MADFPHLKLPIKVEGVARPGRGGGNKKLPQSFANLDNRAGHGFALQTAVKTVFDNWVQSIESKAKAGMEIPNTTDIPIFLQVDPNAFNIESLQNWGIDLISEENDGFIIGSSGDNLELFNKNLQEFLNERGIYKDTAAKIWDIASTNTWRVDNFLKGVLKETWETIVDDKQYLVEIGVSCPVLPSIDYPVRSNYDMEVKFLAKIAEFKAHEEMIWKDRDEKQIAREVEIEKYMTFYSGDIVDLWDNDVDAIFFKLSLNGACLKDIVLTYPYLYEARFSPEFNLDNGNDVLADNLELQINAPGPTASKVCIIDSGIQENHRLLATAIDNIASKSYVNGDSDVSDFVKQSGHGTRVAGAVLYPRGIPTQGTYDQETILQNARILRRDNKISDSEFGPALMKKIVQDFAPTRIFNLSVSENMAYTDTHMAPLPAAIDKLMHEEDVLFIIAAGNIYESNVSVINPGISEHLVAGRDYPNFLDEQSSGIACPGTSSFAITVGSVGHIDYEDADFKSMAGNNFVSPFSRTGLGMWKVIKPDVVEYGGDIVKNKRNLQITTNEEVCPELVNSTMHGSSATGKSGYGTSFAAPKVTYIASKLQAEHPTESAQMYRALIIQSARLPQHCIQNPTLKDIRYYGYGIPDVGRALNNYPQRITFIQNGELSAKKADIYNIAIPNELRGEGKNFSFMVEVTLAFTSRIRQTRKGAHSYLATWLEWRSSKYNESFQAFRNRTIEYLENEDVEEDGEEGGGSIQWRLRENPKYSQENGINRNNSTVQKSWAYIQPHQLTDTFSLAIVGHIGWDKNLEHEISYALCVSFEILGQELNIYDLIARAQIPIDIQADDIEEEIFSS